MSHRPLVLELQHHVGRLLDADLILTADGDALTAALRGVVCGASTGHEQVCNRYLEQFIRTLEALVEAGDLPPIEADPALGIARKALTGVGVGGMVDRMKGRPTPQGPDAGPTSRSHGSSPVIA